MTKPLLTMTAELLRQQDELTKIILLKDKEIDDYISQGARPSRSMYVFFCFFYVYDECLQPFVLPFEIDFVEPGYG